ncbi:hypothetical protein N0M98_17545 [Paenibacillus doosanensis]|uniref:Uncharacterized protein n=1 Tax=Paenibacillus konkukensis TaxID=2020716 RepID=A0ABY4RHF4_9BACL|nr:MULTISPECIES: hypothetical protein [Paenibacillus]MCS7461944.1 hypothetical protein [Paenibacillus doosanensis]UQZ81455.1 hypothetical protein SK3146_00611 [Paenibacillus konkukensis]
MPEMKTNLPPDQYKIYLYFLDRMDHADTKEEVELYFDKAMEIIAQANSRYKRLSHDHDL